MALFFGGRVHVRLALRQRIRKAEPIALTPMWRQASGMASPLITRSRDVLDGAPVFAGTRVLVQSLTDYLEAGETIDAFLVDFPTVQRTQVIAFLESARDQLVAATT